MRVGIATTMKDKKSNKVGLPSILWPYQLLLTHNFLFICVIALTKSIICENFTCLTLIILILNSQIIHPLPRTLAILLHNLNFVPRIDVSFDLKMIFSEGPTLIQPVHCSTGNLLRKWVLRASRTRRLYVRKYELMLLINIRVFWKKNMLR